MHFSLKISFFVGCCNTDAFAKCSVENTMRIHIFQTWWNIQSTETLMEVYVLTWVIKSSLDRQVLSWFLFLGNRTLSSSILANQHHLFIPQKTRCIHTMIELWIISYMFNLSSKIVYIQNSLCRNEQHYAWLAALMKAGINQPFICLLIKGIWPWTS